MIKNKKLLADWPEVLGLTLPTLVFIACSGYVADGVKGDLLFDGLLLYSHSPNVLYWRIGIIVTVFILALISAYWLYRRGMKYLPVRHLEECQKPENIRVLIATVSAISPDSTLAFSIDGVPHLKTAKFDGILPPTLENVTTENFGNWNWQLLLRAIKPHAEGLKKIYLIGSPSPKGSSDKLGDSEKLIKFYLPNVEILRDSSAIDFENIALLYEEFEKTIHRLGSENETILDVTGGQKTASIAAALVTLHHPDLHFQYVSQNDPKKVLYHNVATAGSSSVGG